MTQPMMCARCAIARTWPTDFPHHVYAICRECYPAWHGRKVQGARPVMGFLYAMWRAIWR